MQQKDIISHAEIVIIGGGVVGTSILYHLIKAGYKEVVLLEKNLLTSGSTWHAAGLLPLFNMSYAVGQIHKYSLELYPKLEAETGQKVSFHQVGNLRLATTKERMDEYLAYASTAKTIGIEFQFLSPKEIKKLWPLAKSDDLYGAIFHPTDGHIAPADLTQAFAIASRNLGAKIYQNTIATKISKNNITKEWNITTNKGNITCEKIVTATGNYAKQTLAMFGIDAPVIPVEHQYIVTGDIDELKQRHQQKMPEMPILREPDVSSYIREEGQGFILGIYEKNAPCWGVNGVPRGFGQELLQPDLERLEKYIEHSIKRVPCLEKGGIKECVNGPISYTPDGNPLLGKAPYIDNLYIAEGFSFGITAAGGAGKFLTEIIQYGDPSIDLLAIDPKRFGKWATTQYAIIKNKEAYEHVYAIHYPDEERPAARPLRTTPCYDRLKNRGAVFGQKYGWERPNWFAPKGVPQKDHWSFRRSRYFKYVNDEVLQMHHNVGLIDMSGFSKNIVSGNDAKNFLENILANAMPSKIGNINLAHALNHKGAIKSEFTITKLDENKFYLVSAGAQENYDLDYLYAMRSGMQKKQIHIENVTTKYGVFVIAGPQSRNLLEKITDTKLDNHNFPWLSAKKIMIKMAPVTALRVNFVGELGWEIHHPIEMQNYLFDLIEAAGKEFNIAMVGMRAMFAMALEKSYRNIGKELSVEISAIEAGMQRFIRMKKPYFIGQEAIKKQIIQGKKSHLVTLEVDAKGADSNGTEALIYKGEIVGRATTGGYGARIGKSLAMGFVKHQELTETGVLMSIDILGDLRPCKVIPESPFDPKNLRLRA